MTNNSICLPLEEAIKLAVKENIERDIRLGCIELCEKPITDEYKYIYEEEARELFKTTGSNYNPEFPDHHFIFVLK